MSKKKDHIITASDEAKSKQKQEIISNIKKRLECMQQILEEKMKKTNEFYLTHESRA